MAIDRYKPSAIIPSYGQTSHLTKVYYDQVMQAADEIAARELIGKLLLAEMARRAEQSAAAYAQSAKRINDEYARHASSMTRMDVAAFERLKFVVAQAHIDWLQQSLAQLTTHATRPLEQPRKKSFGDEFLRGFTFGLYDPDRR